MKILVVDDERVARARILACLERWGHEAVGGTMFLDDEAEIPLRAPDLTAPEQRDFATSMGPRLFRVGQKGNREVRTLSTSADPLTGLRVVWTFAAGRDAPTLAPV